MRGYRSELHDGVNSGFGCNATQAFNRVGAFQYSLILPLIADSKQTRSHHKEEIQVPTPILPITGISILYKSAVRLAVRSEVYKAGNVCRYQMIPLRSSKGLSTRVSKFLYFKVLVHL